MEEAVVEFELASGGRDIEGAEVWEGWVVRGTMGRECLKDRGFVCHIASQMAGKQRTKFLNALDARGVILNALELTLAQRSDD